MEGSDGIELGKHKQSPFNWRNYIERTINIPKEQVEQLDVLASIINAGSPQADEFLTDLYAGKFRQPALSFVQFFRDILAPDELKALLRTIRTLQ